MNDDKRFAVLIDAENISAKYLKFIFDELSNYGIVTYKRIYGDWTNNALKSWKESLLNNSITPIQQYSYTSGKNSTDSAMIIDAMDILYSGNIEGFCIVSSDSDFTKLVSRLREAGKQVIGMGEKKTPKPFMASCNRFVYLEVIAQSNTDSSLDTVKSTDVTPIGDVPSTDEVVTIINSIVTDSSDDDGWIALSDVGNILTKRLANFDVRNYGFNKLTPFVRSLNSYDVKSIIKNNLKLIYIKRR